MPIPFGFHLSLNQQTQPSECFPLGAKLGMTGSDLLTSFPNFSGHHAVTQAQVGMPHWWGWVTVSTVSDLKFSLHLKMNISGLSLPFLSLLFFCSLLAEQN